MGQFSECAMWGWRHHFLSMWMAVKTQSRQAWNRLGRSSARKRPRRMRRKGRAEDPTFEPVEKLFRRYKREHIVGGAFSGVGLSFKTAPSLNREKYSQPQDVLFSEADEFADWGVVSLQVQHIPASVPSDHPLYNLFPKHVPL